MRRVGWDGMDRVWSAGQDGMDGWNHGCTVELEKTRGTVERAGLGAQALSKIHSIFRAACWRVESFHFPSPRLCVTSALQPQAHAMMR